MNLDSRGDDRMHDEIDAAKVKAALATYNDPETGRNVVEMGQVKEIHVDGKRIDVTLGLTSYSAPLWPEAREAVMASLRREFPAASHVSVTIQQHERRPEKIGEIGLPAKSVIVVGSGKGGVGKSTIAAAIAYGLQRAGSIVGLVDADVYGPSIPQLLGVEGRPAVVDNRIQPIDHNGMKVMSMGFLVPAGEAVVWRGPMLHGAITQFLRDTAWGDLDYLIIDMPPGTGDIALTLSQLLPLTGAVVVCTPQKVALLDAIKAIAMFRKVKIPILGMVENMSGFICPGCHNRYDIFGRGGAEQTAKELQVPFLGGVPINLGIRTRGDAGTMAEVYLDDAIRPPLEHLTLALVRGLAERAQGDPPLPSLSVL
jgi:ATP-binding protein involved in chromosome partitioning